MTRKPPELLPLTPATVTVNGSNFGPRAIIWAGFQWTEGQIDGWHRISSRDHCLAVPWCHPDDDTCLRGVYRVRPRDERYRFERAANGLFVLRLQP